MRSGHIIYKVNNLHLAVEAWRAKGFVVEYGSKTNPVNALIYFSEGPYIELLQHTGIPKLIKLALKLVGQGKKLERFNYWDTCDEGVCGFCIEKDPGSLDEEVAFLKQNGIKGVQFKHLKRVDIKGRVLAYQCFFPEGIMFPFLMTYFTVDPKPSNFVHPNGIKRIKRIVFSIDEANAAILRQLVNEEGLEIITDENRKGIIDVTYDQSH